MFKFIKSVLAPLLSLFILILGNGMFNTLVSVRLDLDGASSWIIGTVSAAYYAGLVVGSFKIEPFISRVGHIRAFAAFAAMTAVICLLPGLWVNNLVWILLRFIGGYCIAGLFIVIESWLLASSPAEVRGKVLSFYMITLYAAQGSGQFLLNLSNPQTLIPFCIATILVSLAIIPVSMTYQQSPSLPETSTLKFKKLYKASPTGVLGCFASGLILGAIYGLIPMYVSSAGFSVKDISLTMGMIIFGGMLLQYPVGHLSDIFDRRLIIAIISGATAILSLLIIPALGFSKSLFMILAFIFGGCTFTLYPICISHSCDYLESEDIVAATGGLLLSYGIGATLGPLIAPSLISMLGDNGLFLYFAIVSGTFLTFIIWRSTRRSSLPADEQQDFIAVPHTTPITAEMDPRSDDEELQV